MGHLTLVYSCHRSGFPHQAIDASSSPGRELWAQPGPLVASGRNRRGLIQAEMRFIRRISGGSQNQQKENQAQQKGRDHRRVAAENTPAMPLDQCPLRPCCQNRAKAVEGHWQGDGLRCGRVDCESCVPLRVALCPRGSRGSADGEGHTVLQVKCGQKEFFLCRRVRQLLGLTRLLWARVLHWEGGVGGNGGSRALLDGAQDSKWVQGAWMTEQMGPPNKGEKASYLGKTQRILKSRILTAGEDVVQRTRGDRQVSSVVRMRVFLTK